MRDFKLDLVVVVLLQLLDNTTTFHLGPARRMDRAASEVGRLLGRLRTVVAERRARCWLMLLLRSRDWNTGRRALSLLRLTPERLEPKIAAVHQLRFMHHVGREHRRGTTTATSHVTIPRRCVVGA